MPRAPLLVALAAPLLAAFQRSAAPAGAPPPGEEPRQVRIRVVDAGGQPLPDAEVRIAHAKEGLEPHAIDVDGRVERQAVLRLDAHGERTVEWPRDHALLVAARRGDLWGFRWLAADRGETEGRDPPEGEPLRVELVPDWPVRVRVEDDAGRPLRDLAVRLRGAPKPCAGTAVDDELVFGHVGFCARGALRPLEVQLEALVSPPIAAALAPDRPPPGPIVLRAPPLGAVEVHVARADGRQANLASVSLRLADPPGAEGRRFEERPTHFRLTRAGTARFDGVALGLDLEVGLEDEGETWTRIRGPTWSGETVQVAVTLAERAPGELDTLPPTPPRYPVASGASASLSGTLLLDPHVRLGEVEVILRGSAPVFERAASLSAGGGFTFSSVPPGAARLEVWPKGVRTLPEDEGAVFRADCMLFPGENVDPSLAAIDLRGKLFRHEIVLRGATPGAPFDARVYFRRARLPAGPWCYLHPHEPGIALVSSWPEIDVELFAPGYRAVTLLDLGARAEVDLEPGLPVRLRLVCDGALPAPPRYLKASLGPTRELVTTAWKPGRTKVVWIAARHAADGRSGGGVAPAVGEPQFVDVLDDPRREQVFEVRLSAEELAQLLRAGG